MNSNEDLFAFVSKSSALIESYSKSIDNINLLAVLVGLCKEIGRAEGIKPKDFRRKLKEIIDLRESDVEE